MSSALSGLRNHQVMLDVVGNDIANVSTVGFKSSTTVFSDVLTQTLNGASVPSAVTAGTNPAQIGLGSRLAGTIQSFTQGAIQRTGRSTDLAIQGDGFFIVDDGGQPLYTRAGALAIDAAGTLATPDGMLVQGWMADASGAINTNASIGPVEISVGDLLPPVQTTDVELGGNLAADSPVGTISSLTVAVYDDQGTAVPLNLAVTKTAADEWTVTATAGTPPAAVALTDNVLTFDGFGELTAPADRNMNIAAGALPGFGGAVTIDLGGATQAGRITQYAGSPTAGVIRQNGSAAGALQTFTIGQDGVVTGNYSNGRTRPIGQVALAVFSNPGGLERVAGAWRETPNSGLAQVGGAGVGARGLLSAGTLEMSNVDLAEEFTRLIVAQRGFQGNARVITTADEVLQEVVNLRR
ncbi:MAG: flagellar hook protein FlgE [Ilumatobacter sp.]|uniref:flagellar hook protein FlgE n=1 Tax=Ilumatobacter sp. TaxID=1967498 RepID=UPI0026299787|nr:flagellar hook protein FlgE [Ilumatobacter sp.]MDJ0767464.1 flagellar hook protein FlgE [Ilumatobacter sp.]